MLTPKFVLILVLILVLLILVLVLVLVSVHPLSRRTLTPGRTER